MKKRKAAKDRQVHFWVDAALSRAFHRAAKSIGETAPEAHRRAMKGYVDQGSPEGSVFRAETAIVLGGRRILARIFTSGRSEILVRLTGLPIRTALQWVGRLSEDPRSRSAREAGAAPLR